MRATGEHTAAVPIPAPPPMPQAPGAVAEDAAEKERRRRRRAPRRPKQAGAAQQEESAAGPRPSRSMPPMREGAPLDAEAEEEDAWTCRSCPLVPTPGPVEPPVMGIGLGAAGRLFFQSHWPEQAVEEAIKGGNAFMAKFRVNAHNRNEAYCTIEGIPVDVLITGVAQNRAIEGDLVAIALEPVAYWTRMKGPNIVCNPAIGEGSAVDEVGETNGNHDGKKGQTDASCRFGNCSNGQPVLDRMHNRHKNSGFSKAVKCENGHATVSENCEDLGEGKTEASRALHRICAMVYSNPSRRPTGKVLSVIKKSPRRDTVVGFLAPFSVFPDSEQQKNQMNMQVSKSTNHRGSSYFSGLVLLLPTDPKFPRMVVSANALPDSVIKQLEEGAAAKELVAARISEWNEESLYPCAQVIQLLGKGGQVKTHMDAILFENSISDAEFSHESMECLPDISWKIPQEELEGRKDLRNVLTFTIDPPTATDLDDAISIEMLSGGIVRIGVHIADVSYFVHPETALDAEAQIRSTSVYTLRRKISMLPSRLSEDLVSLNPGVDRLAFSIIWDIDPHGNIVNRWIGRSVIFSCCKLSYDLVQDLIYSDGTKFRSASSLQVHGIFKQEDVIKSLRCLYEISKNLKEIRFKGGALSLETAKLMILFDDSGDPCDSCRYERNDACFIVEELMLLANMSAAEIISNSFPNCSLLRRHPEPNLRKSREFEAFCARNGFELDGSSSGQLHLSLSRMKEKLKEDPVLFDILMFYASKQMQSAEYFCTAGLISKRDDWAHYALSVPLYTHFTSPLRRYPDIIVHRTLNAVIEAEKMYLKQRRSLTGQNGLSTTSREMMRGCFTGLQFNKDAAESKEGSEALSAAAKKFKVPSSDNLGEVAEHCNKRKWASRRAEEAGQKLYMWAMIKRKEVLVAHARVLGLGPKFMSVYVPKLAMEQRIHYDEVEGLSIEWLEATGTLVLDACRNRPPRRRGNQVKYRAFEEVAMVVNPSEAMLSEEDEESGATEAGCDIAKSVLPSDEAVKAQVAPAVLPLVVQYLSEIPVVLHAIGGEDSAVDIGVRLYMSSYFK
ncbi:DIS3-like exonuclease 2 [Oryza brachyantha]|uniref:DIS3-like exonuclease 2 n=1 Tax=Oryza brachyantha TaxID=4533 RepID=UPI001ADA55F1|nr:DIS3-like exonuclease 2 [Oryza brachyantha]